MTIEEEDDVRISELPAVHVRFLNNCQNNFRPELNHPGLRKEDHFKINKSSVKSKFKLPTLNFPFSPKKVNLKQVKSQKDLV